MQEVKENKEAFKNVNIPFGKASDSNKIDMSKIAAERAEKAARESMGKVNMPVGPNLERGTGSISIGDVRRDTMERDKDLSSRMYIILKDI